MLGIKKSRETFFKLSIIPSRANFCLVDQTNRSLYSRAKNPSLLTSFRVKLALIYRHKKNPDFSGFSWDSAFTFPIETVRATGLFVGSI